MPIPITNTPPKELRALKRIVDNSDVTRLNRRMIAELRLSKLIYTVWDEGAQKRRAHLTAKGREALERNP